MGGPYARGDPEFPGPDCAGGPISFPVGPRLPLHPKLQALRLVLPVELEPRIGLGRRNRGVLRGNPLALPHDPQLLGLTQLELLPLGHLAVEPEVQLPGLLRRRRVDRAAVILLVALKLEPTLGAGGAVPSRRGRVLGVGRRRADDQRAEQCGQNKAVDGRSGDDHPAPTRERRAGASELIARPIPNAPPTAFSTSSISRSVPAARAQGSLCPGLGMADIPRPGAGA